MATEGKLKGKVALVTGGSRGIGKEISIALASDGAAVVVSYAGNDSAATETVGCQAARGGRIITTSSSLTGFIRPGYGAYTATKAAAEVLTKTLAKELKGKRITVNCIAPGPVATEMFFQGKTQQLIDMMAKEPPLERLGKPKDIAAVTQFLASDESEWVNGQVIRINGGTV
ncbi:unnamed protein product [Calypogeia fissa]